eukprot:8585688-Alexandrium_andersonii.AAC.1
MCIRDRLRSSGAAASAAGGASSVSAVPPADEAAHMGMASAAGSGRTPGAGALLSGTSRPPLTPRGASASAAG